MILSIVLFLAAVICYSIRDLKSFSKLKWSKGSYGFWDQESYLRKYKKNWEKDPLGYDVYPPKDNWYYRFFKIKYKENFPLSATLLVFVTDGYHLMQFFYKLLFCSAFYPLTNWWFPVVLWFLWTIVLESMR